MHTRYPLTLHFTAIFTTAAFALAGFSKVYAAPLVSYADLFQKERKEEVLREFGALNAKRSNKIKISASDIAENGARVPVTIESKIPGTELILLMVDDNPRPLVAMYDIGKTEPIIKNHIKVSKNSTLRVVIKAGNEYFTGSKLVKLTSPGCGGGGANMLNDYGQSKTDTKKGNRIKIKTRHRGDRTEVLALIQHPMETGLRVNKKTKKKIPAHYIRELTARVNGNEVVKALWGSAIASNPLTVFYLRQANQGDIVNISWVDNKGMSDEANYKIH